MALPGPAVKPPPILAWYTRYLRSCARVRFAGRLLASNTAVVRLNGILLFFSSS